LTNLVECLTGASVCPHSVWWCYIVC